MAGGLFLAHFPSGSACQSTLTGGAGSGGACEAMAAYDDFAFGQPVVVKILDMIRDAAVYRQIEHLVEVAIVQTSVPSYRKGGPAHETSYGLNVEGAL